MHKYPVVTLGYYVSIYTKVRQIRHLKSHSQPKPNPLLSIRVKARPCRLVYKTTDRRAQGLTTTDLDTSSQRALLFLRLCSSYKSYPSRGNQFNGVVFASIDGPMVITAHGLGANIRPDRP
jgi:hypothetical protein